MSNKYVLWFEEVGMHDVPRVGGKNASLGEMIRELGELGVNVPGGYATTADAYRDFLTETGLKARIDKALSELDVDDVAALTRTGKQIRQWILETELPGPLREAITEAHRQLEARMGAGHSVAVRSSATAEDLPDASFAGQQETLLNVRGLPQVLDGIRVVFASLFNDRAIAYRVHKGFAHEHVALSAGVQQMARSDLGASGVMFTLDTESGFSDVVFITAAYGLGETVVQGSVNPDEFYVHKPLLKQDRPAVLRRTLGDKAIKMVYSAEETEGHGHPTLTVDVPEPDRERFCITDEDVLALARQAVIIEGHYGRPMDIEWAKDGESGQIYIVQARPETVKSQGGLEMLQRYRLKERGETLVTDMTDPDWEPVMKRAAAIVTNRGGRTCHAAIIARELGIPAVVGTGDATSVLRDGQQVTVSCAEGDTGYVYAGELDFEVSETDMSHMPSLPFKIMMNVGNPERAFDFQFLPNAGIGLARLEFIINRTIGIHPKALLNFADQSKSLQATIRSASAGYADPVTFYVEKLAEGIATLAGAFWPKPVIVRMSDFKSNEYANLIGGERYEPQEENPMLGFRGASRYISEDFRDCFELECRALKRVRDEIGLTNVEIMVPFVRTVGEARRVTELLADNGLRRGENGLRLIMMCEIPSNA